MNLVVFLLAVKLNDFFYIFVPTVFKSNTWKKCSKESVISPFNNNDNKYKYCNDVLYVLRIVDIKNTKVVKHFS